jgi:hypothetical protein
MPSFVHIAKDIAKPAGLPVSLVSSADKRDIIDVSKRRGPIVLQGESGPLMSFL